MNRVTLAGSCGLLLVLFVACADDDKAAQTDASTHEPAKPLSDAGKDAGPQLGGDTPPDLHALLIATLIETERALIARCPCLAEIGSFKSKQECVRALSLGRDWVECSNATDLTGQDDAAVRANLRCNLQELSQRTECLTGSSCDEKAVVACMSPSLSCPMLPLDVLSHVAVECSISLSR